MLARPAGTTPGVRSKDGVVCFPSEIYEGMGIKSFVKPIEPEVAEK
jgi:hypothetical protein